METLFANGDIAEKLPGHLGGSLLATPPARAASKASQEAVWVWESFRKGRSTGTHSRNSLMSGADLQGQWVRWVWRVRAHKKHRDPFNSPQNMLPAFCWF